MMEQKIQTYIKPGEKVHLVGIGGVSMAPLAEVLKGKGLEVTGSDMHESPAVDRLRSLGIPVAIGHRGGECGGGPVRHPHRRRPRRQPGDRRRPGGGHPGVRAGPGLGGSHVPLSKRPVRGGHPRQDHHHLHVHHIFLAAAGTPR